MFKVIQASNQIHIQTDKFKDVMFSYRFTYPNTEPQVTLANLLAYILSDRSEKYPTKLSMSQRMDELYGCSIQTKTSSYGQVHSLEFRAKTLSPRYTPVNIVDEVIAFMLECLTRPLINQDTFDEAKINLLNALGRLEDNPTVQGFQLAAKAIAKTGPLSVFSQGNKAVLDSVTLKDVQAFHQELLTQSMVKLISADSKLDLPQLSALGPATPPSAYVFDTVPFQEVRTQKPVPQTTLTQLYTHQIAYGAQDYLPMRILVLLLGQLPNSLLFTEVREKRSLCYSIHATSINFDGILAIQTGIELQKLSEVESLIQEQIQRIQTGKFSKALMEIAKKMMISNMASIEDDRSAYFNYLFQRHLTHQDPSIKSLLKQIRQVTKEDVIRVALKLNLVSQSVIEGGSHE